MASDRRKNLKHGRPTARPQSGLNLNEGMPKDSFNKDGERGFIHQGFAH
jgi:hypothetical protein